MSILDKWGLLKSYRRQSDRHLLKCSECGEEYASIIGVDDEPLFIDAYCGTEIYFGVDHWRKIEQALDSTV